MEYLKGTSADRNEIITFINQVFDVEFREIMGKVYQSKEEFESYHHLVKEDGKIMAAVGVYEQTFVVGSSKLKTGCIGSVSVSNEARGKGYMKLLMKKADEDMRKNHVAIAMLCGLRNRYGFYGYQMGGQVYEFQMEEENIRHTIGWGEDTAVQLIPVESEDDPALDAIYELYQKKTMHCRNRDDFYIRSKTWNHKLIQIQINNQFAGYYLTNTEQNFIPEIELVDYSQLLQVLKACLLRIDKKSLKVQAHEWEPEKALKLEQVCEIYESKPNYCYKILDYPVALKAMLELKQAHDKLDDGSFLLNVTDVGAFLMTIQAGKVSVVEVDAQASNQAIDMELSSREVIDALISPAFHLYEAQTKSGYPKGWFPLSFSPDYVDLF